MKIIIFFLVLFLAGCASQNNSPKKQMEQAKKEPSTKSPIEGNNTQSADVNIEETSKKVDSRDMTSETKNSDMNKKETYLCTFDSIYEVHSASSVETNGGKLFVSIDEGNLNIKSRSAEVPGNYILKLRRKTNFQIFAASKSKQFIYNAISKNFVFNTGIGSSGFNISKGGHTGRQMRASGKCDKS